MPVTRSCRIVASCLLTLGLAAAARAAEPPDMGFFGVGACSANNRSAEADATWMPQMAAIGVTNTRCVSTDWGSVEPEEGQWKWDKIDAQMSYMESQHFAFGGILIGKPKWDKLDQKGLPVNNLPAWSKYVFETVKHCQGRIKYWELWNEPPNGTGGDKTAPEYAKLAVATYDAAKRADPNAMVGLAAKSVFVNYIDQAIKAGARGHFDYITLHPYEAAGIPLAHPGMEQVYLRIVPAVRKMLAAQDPSKVHCPIIFTELGAAADGKYATKIPGFTPPEGMAHAVVKFYVMGLAQGVTSIDWFEGKDSPAENFYFLGLLDVKGTPRPGYTAMAQLIKYLSPRPTYLGWVLLNDKHYGFVFQGAKGPVLATWAATWEPDTIDFGQPVKIVDPLTGNVTEAASHKLTLAPILVDGVPDALVQKARDNKNKPLPWGGDYSQAKSVSVTYGQKNVEKGLHTMSAESVAENVVAFGGGARVGNVPGGTTFMIDPNFLLYDTVPVEVAAVVRRNPAAKPGAKPPTLTLSYESVSGMRNAPPCAIPENDGWNTVKWKLDDVQFIGQYGFNFSLNHGDYLIQSMTVTRLDRP
jgi:hypothetical protein